MATATTITFGSWPAQWASWRQPLWIGGDGRRSRSRPTPRSGAAERWPQSGGVLAWPAGSGRGAVVRLGLRGAPRGGLVDGSRRARSLPDDSQRPPSRGAIPTTCTGHVAPWSSDTTAGDPGTRRWLTRTASSWMSPVPRPSSALARRSSAASYSSAGSDTSKSASCSASGPPISTPLLRRAAKIRSSRGSTHGHHSAGQQGAAKLKAERERVRPTRPRRSQRPPPGADTGSDTTARDLRWVLDLRDGPHALGPPLGLLRCIDIGTSRMMRITAILDHPAIEGLRPESAMRPASGRPAILFASR